MRGRVDLFVIGRTVARYKHSTCFVDAKPVKSRKPEGCSALGVFAARFRERRNKKRRCVYCIHEGVKKQHPPAGVRVF